MRDVMSEGFTSSFILGMIAIMVPAIVTFGASPNVPGDIDVKPNIGGIGTLAV